MGNVFFSEIPPQSFLFLFTTLEGVFVAINNRMLLISFDMTSRLCVLTPAALYTQGGREHRSDVVGRWCLRKISHRKHKHEKFCRCSLQVLVTATTTGGKVCVNKNNCPLCSIHQSMSVALNLRITSLPSLAD